MKRLVLMTLFACHFDPAADRSIAAAKSLTRQYAQQELKASAAGSDCGVLLIRMDSTLDHGTVESIHYGTGKYGVYEGGVEQFAEDRKFRAVVYRDEADGLWTYGSITRSEAQSMKRCR